MPYSEHKPRPWRPCFLLDQNFFKESLKGPPKEHSCHIIMESIDPFYRRRFFKFTICCIVKTSPAHGGHVFCRIKISSRNLEEVHPRNIHAKLYWNPLSHFGEEDFLSFSFWLPWQPEFRMELISLKEFWRGPCKEHSCEVWLDLAK